MSPGTKRALGVAALALCVSPIAWSWTQRGLAHQAAQVLAETPCDQDPRVGSWALRALLRADLDDPGCSDDARLHRLIAQDPATRQALARTLERGGGPGRLRLRAAIALSGQDDARALVDGVLASGALGPEQRDELEDAVVHAQGPVQVLDARRTASGGVYDAGATWACERFAAGDQSGRVALQRALERELRRPTLPPTHGDVGVSYRGARLVHAALTGLGMSPETLVRDRDALRSGRVPADLSTQASDALASSAATCEQPDAPCMALLVELLATPLDPWDEQQVLDDLEPDLDWPAEWAWHTSDPELLAEAADWIRAAPDPAGRLLGTIANPRSGFGPLPLSAGQRGDPADAVRYAGSTPGATAAAAVLLGQATGVQISLSGTQDLIRVEAGGRAAWVGPCGPGAAPSDAALPPITDQDALDLAGWERVAGWLAAGHPDRAIDASIPLRATPRWTAWIGLREALLACQGLDAPLSSAPEHAQAWGAWCAGEPVPTALPEPACASALQPPWPPRGD